MIRREPVLVLALLTAWPGVVGAEINIAPSVEWLTSDAVRIVAGRIASLRPAPADAAGKNRGLSLATLEVTETLKGPHLPRLCLGLRDLDPGALERHRVARAELLFFLGRSIQATSFEKRVCDHWPLRGEGGVPLLVPLAAPGKRILSATSFKVLKARGEIVAACKETLRRLAARKSPPAAVKKRLLEVPFGTEAHAVLWGGSTCYLEVPDLLFPKARPSLR